MSKKRILTSLVLCLLAILCLAVFSGCTLFGAKYEISWTVDFEKEPSDNAKITVEGYDELPSQIPAGDEITVTIEGINGYKVYRVKVNNRKIQADENGKYVFTVSEKTVVEITLREKVESVNMPDITFYAGEEIDRKAVEAEIVYATGRTEKTNKYSVIYQSEGAESFSLGDTYYTVRLSADRDNVYKVQMKQPVCCKGVIDPYGGVIADSYVNSLKENTEIENVTVEDDGSISFTFNKPLTSDIALPSADQISKGEGDDFVFQDWSGSIIADTDKSVTATAVYKAKLVTFTSITLESREVDGVNVPYLVVKGQFEAANSVYLYFYEGTKKLELVDPNTVGGEDTERYESFEILFDMREINDKEFFGAWLDVKVRTEINGHIETQEINLSEYEDSLIDLESYIRYNGYRYEFQVYEGCLKIEKSEYFEHGYKMSYSLNDDGEVILTISGNVVARYAGNAVQLDIEYDIDGGTRTVETQYCIIDENGDYSVSMNLFSIPLGCNAYVHFWIIDSIEEENVIYVGKENNLQNDWCENDDLKSKYNNVGLITDGGIRCANADSTQTYFVGKGQWGGIVIYGKDDTAFSYSTDSAKIYLENDRVKIAVTGSYSGTKEEMEEEIAAWVSDLQENPYVAGRTDWGGSWITYKREMTSTVNDDNSFSIVIDVTDIEWSETNYPKACYTFHLGREGQGYNNQNPDLKLTGELGNSSVTLNGKTYTLVSVRGSTDPEKFWGCLGLTIQ